MKPSELDRSCPGTQAVRNNELHVRKLEEDGVLMHKLLEESINKRIDPVLVYSGERLSEKQIAHVHDVYRYCIAISCGSGIYTEYEIDMTGVSGVDQKGIADIVIFSAGVVTVVDAKFGPSHRKIVAAEHNQTTSYGGAIAFNNPGVHQVRTVVMQPFIGHISEHIMSRHDAIIAAKRLFIRGECEPGDACERCPVSPSCTSNAKVQLGRVLHSLQPCTSMTDSQLSELMEHAQQIIVWLEDVKTESRIRAEKGRKIDGFKLIDGKRRRTWTDEDTAANELTREALIRGIKEKVVVPISPAQADAIFGDGVFDSIVDVKKMPPLLVKELRRKAS